MANYRKVACLSLLYCLILAGCTTGQNVRIGAEPDDYRKNYPINVVMKDAFVSVPVASSGKRLTTTQLEKIDQVKRIYDENGKGPIVVRIPDNLSRSNEVERQSRLIVSAFKSKRYNVLIGSPYHVTVGVSSFRIEFGVLKAETKPCGRWPEDILDDSSNRHYANFGCSVRSNLAAQISDPQDLITPRTQSSIDAERRANVIDDYRSARANRTSEIRY